MKATKKILIYPFLFLGLVLFTLNACDKDDDPKDPPANGNGNGNGNGYEGPTVTDIDGNVYKTVEIDGREWMAENLRVINYNDGTPIDGSPANWVDHPDGAYSWYDNNEASYGVKYGALYNWHAVGTGKLCPDGWQVPTDQEWIDMMLYLIENGYNYDGTTAGNKIAKALASQTEWEASTNEGAVGNDLSLNNATEFNGLPTGFRQGTEGGSFLGMGESTYFWSADESDSESAFGYFLNSHLPNLDRMGHHKNSGKTIRCIKK